MLIPLACSSFLAHCRDERALSRNTLCAYLQDLNEFQAFVGVRPISELQGSDLVAYVRHLAHNRHLAPATVKRRVACLRSFFRWLSRTSTVGENPFSRVEIRTPVPDRLPRCLSREDMASFARAAEGMADATRLAANLLFATGARVSELTAIRLDDIDIGSGTIRIVGKGNRERHVFVPDGRVLDRLAEFMRDRRSRAGVEGKLLASNDGRPLSQSVVRARMRAVSRAAGLARVVTPHVIRHTTATSLLEAGVDVRFVQKLLGHRSITTTQLYTHVSDSALRMAITRADLCRTFESTMRT